MERIKQETRRLLLLLLLVVLQVCSDANECSKENPDLTCISDYYRTISCVRNVTHTHMDADCKLVAKKDDPKISRRYSASCDLRLEDGLGNCTMVFHKVSIFQSEHELNVSLTCGQAEPLVSIRFKPVCHIKLNPPEKPQINNTVVTWTLSPIGKLSTKYTKTELHWRRRGQSWTAEVKSDNPCCEKQLDKNVLLKGETYEARARAKTTVGKYSTWSDWSPVASWVSPVGNAPPAPKLPPGVHEGILSMVIVGVGLALVVGVLLFRNEKVTWVYKKIKGPDPSKSFLKDVNFQSFNTFPHLSFLSTMKLDDIASVEVVSTVDAVLVDKESAALLGKAPCNWNASSFSNPSYAQCPPFPLPSLGNLESCASDTPYASVQAGAAHAQQDRAEEEEQRMKVQELLSTDQDKSASMLVVCDYKQVGNLQVEPSNLQSSGTWSGDAVRQSPEGDGIHALEKKEERELAVTDFQTLFGSGPVVFGKSSIQISSDYEQVPGLRPASPELPSLDSGVSSGGEEQASHEESLEEVHHTPTRFPSLPRPTCAPALSLKLVGTGSSLAAALRSMSPGLEPADDGYLPGDR